MSLNGYTNVAQKYDVNAKSLNDDTYMNRTRVRDFVEIYLSEEPRKALFWQIFRGGVCSLGTRDPDVDAVQTPRSKC